VVLKPGWLSRQFDQVTKDVETWPEWMKRAAGFADDTPRPESERSPENRETPRELEHGPQGSLVLR
jgi:hypothetical protein